MPIKHRITQMLGVECPIVQAPMGWIALATRLRSLERGRFRHHRNLIPRTRRDEAYIVSRRERKKVEMLFAHLKRILRLDRLRLRGPCGARGEFLLAAIVQNLRPLAMLIPIPLPATAI
jgi:Transposase DDE domain